MSSFNEFIQFHLLDVGKYSIKVYTVIFIVLIIITCKCLIWLIKKALYRKKSSREDIGNRYALFQISKYFIWIIAVILMLDTIGIKITVLLTSSAALLVGIGLGLQQTFNDIVSGIFILYEHSIQIGDILQIDDDVVKIEKIGLRTSICLNRDDIYVIIPNSQIFNNKVINWSHQTEETRFKINVGVAYGSDIELVAKLLKESAQEHPEVDETKYIEARVIDFGNSSILFQLLFYSDNIFRIERIKSDIRKNINRKFIENHVTIPFPQMDLYLKSVPNDTKIN